MSAVDKTKLNAIPGYVGSVAIFADSIGANNTSTNSTPPFTSYNSTGFFTWANIFLRHRFTLIANKSVPGDSTSGMLARFATDIVALNPRPAILIVEGGGNDIANSSVPNLTAANALAATIISNLKFFYQQAAALGMYVIATTVIPSINFINDANKMACYCQVVNGQKAFCAGRLGISLCDFVPPFLSVHNTITPNFTVDGVHPNSYGAQILGQTLADTMEVLAPPLDILGLTSDFDSSNLLTVGQMQGTGGTNATGGSGSIATGWTAQWGGSPGTYVASKVARSDVSGAEWQQIQLTGAGSFQLRLTVNGTLYSAGMTLQAACEVQPDNDWSGITGCAQWILATDSSGSNTVADAFGDAANGALNPFAGVLQTPPYTLQSSPTAVHFLFNFNSIVQNQVDALPFVDSAGSGTATISVEGVSTAAITYSATPATLVANINAALNAAFGTGNIVASGSTLAGIVLTFSGGTFANRAIGTVQATVASGSGFTINGSGTVGGPSTCTINTPGYSGTGTVRIGRCEIRQVTTP